MVPGSVAGLEHFGRAIMGKSNVSFVGRVQSDDGVGPPGEGHLVRLAVGPVPKTAEGFTLPQPPEGWYSNPAETARGILSGTPEALDLKQVSAGQRMQVRQEDGSWRFAASTKSAMCLNGDLYHVVYEDGSTEAAMRWTVTRLVDVAVGDRVFVPSGEEVVVRTSNARRRVHVRPTVGRGSGASVGRGWFNPQSSRPVTVPSTWKEGDLTLTPQSSLGGGGEHEAAEGPVRLGPRRRPTRPQVVSSELTLTLALAL